MRSVEFQPGEMVIVQIPKTPEELDDEGFFLIPFVGKGMCIVYPFPKSGTMWKAVEGSFVDTLQPKTLVERIETIVFGQWVQVKINGKDRRVAKYLVDKKPQQEPHG